MTRARRASHGSGPLGVFGRFRTPTGTSFHGNLERRYNLERSSSSVLEGSSAATVDGAVHNSGCEPIYGGRQRDHRQNTGPWNDNSGHPYPSHWGGFIKVCDTLYWFGIQR